MISFSAIWFSISIVCVEKHISAVKCVSASCKTAENGSTYWVRIYFCAFLSEVKTVENMRMD